MVFQTRRSKKTSMCPDALSLPKRTLVSFTYSYICLIHFSIVFLSDPLPQKAFCCSHIAGICVDATSAPHRTSKPNTCPKGSHKSTRIHCKEPGFRSVLWLSTQVTNGYQILPVFSNWISSNHPPVPQKTLPASPCRASKLGRCSARSVAMEREASEVHVWTSSSTC